MLFKRINQWIFCKMEWNAYSLARISWYHYFDVDFSIFYILSKHPHFANTVEFINHRTLNIIFYSQIFNNHLPIWWNYLQLLKGFSVFTSVVAKYYAKYFHLGMKFRKKLFYLFFCYHCFASIVYKSTHKSPNKQKSNFKVAHLQCILSKFHF